MSILAKTLATTLCLATFSIHTAAAQATLSICTKDKDHYSCDKQRFTKILKDAKTVAVESRPYDPVSADGLQNLVRKLGKNVQPGSADLIFVLEPTTYGGVYFGPEERELATIRVFARSSRGGHGELLWVESLVGQPDVPWAIVVHDLVQQFKTEFK